MKSAIYEGWLTHQRLLPKRHALRYPVFMLYLDLDEIDEVFGLTRLWSLSRFAPAQFRRADFLNSPDIPLKDEVKKRVFDELGLTVDGPVRLLANMRYFGFSMNPMSTYYCFNAEEQLVALVLEVNNTPWGEKHSYVLACDPDQKKQRITFNKSFHVSPFNPMDIDYHWQSNLPDEDLRIHLANWRNQACEFVANLQLRCEDITASSLRRILWRYPWLTLKVFYRIYWHALLLWAKRLPIFNHPDKEAVFND